VAGIIAGNGTNSSGMYIGVAPMASLYSLKIADKDGQGTTRGVLLAAEWLLVNHAKYNIRVVNMSFSSALAQSYHVDPIDAAVELLWMDGVVVVAAVGNTGPNGVITSPANDPYAIAVGATDTKGTDTPDDDTLALFSSYGTIENGIAKPDLVAPGRHIISVLAGPTVTLAAQHSSNILATNNKYFVLSGTSMAAPMVVGTVALLLQAQPSLTPNQVKGCLVVNAAAPPAGSNTKYVRADGVGVWDCSHATSNQAVPPSQLMVQILPQLTTGGLNWANVNWGNVNWGNVNWGNVNWGNVNWGNVNWGNVAWD
jgi:serine protease AprX